MEASSKNPSTGGGGGGRRHRGRGKRSSNRGGGKHHKGGGNGGTGGPSNNHNAASSNGHKKNLVPPPPQVKLALRNIGNPAAFGTVESVLENILVPLIQASNNSHAGSTGGVTTATPSFHLQLDEAAKRHLIQEEKAALEYQQKIKEQALAKEQKEDLNTKGNSPGTDDTMEVEASSEAPQESVANSTNDVDVIVAPAPKPPSTGIPIVTIRPLYVVPPKKTSHRGDRGGVAYVLLIGPKIEEVSVPESIPELPVGKSIHVDAEKLVDSVPTSTSGVDVPTTDKATPEAPASSTASSIPGAPGQSSFKSGKQNATDYSRAVAQGRLLLQRATDSLTQLTDEDAKGPQHYAQVRVEMALSGKTWRQPSGKPDRRENTLEATPDYIEWLENLAKQTEELKARPKPAPGGGMITTTSSASATGVASAESSDPATGQPVAAIVQHLRAKRQEMKRKNNTKKKKESTLTTTGTTSSRANGGEGRNKQGKKGKSGGTGGSGPRGNSGTSKVTSSTTDKDGGAAMAKKKPKKRPKKKVPGTGGANANGNRKAPSAVAPTRLLKPSAPGGQDSGTPK